MIRSRFVLTLFVVVGFSSRGVGAAPSASSAPSVAASGNAQAAQAAAPSGTAGDTAATGSDGNTAPAPAPVVPLGAEGTDTAATAGVPMVDAAVQAGAGARYGLGVRSRWVSVPSWMLGLFLANSVPLSSYTIGAEFFRRSGNFDFVLGVAWQALSPPDGNWLGKGNSPAAETDFVQFRDFGAVSLDAAFILRTDLNEFVSLHYGGGVGIGITTGKMLRTSDGSAGCAGNPGDVVGCHPVIPNSIPPCVTAGPCTEAQLHTTDNAGAADTPGMPARFSDNRIPSVYPIVNVVTGLDFRIPNMPGFEFKIEGGFFFPYFFLGGGATYRI